MRDLAEREFPDGDNGVGRPRSLTLHQAVRMTLVRLPRNTTYQDLGEDFGVTRQTAWHNVQPIVAFLADVLGCAEQEDLPALVEGKVCLLDGALVVVFTWRHRTAVYSGKHRAAGLNIQVLVDPQGRVITVSRAFPGSWPDLRCFHEAGLAKLPERAGGGIADKGDQGAPATTPIKKQPGVELADADRASNRQLAKIRIAVEWAIAHLQELAHPGHPLPVRPGPHRPDIQAVVGLHKLNEAHAEHRLTFDRIKKTGIVSG